jgi:hypothetical protein
VQFGEIRVPRDVRKSPQFFNTHLGK